MKSIKITINKQNLIVRQLNVEQTLKLALLLLPYVPLIEEKWNELSGILNKLKHRNELLTVFFTVIREDLAKAPKDLTLAFSILINKDEDLKWVVENVSALDIVTLLPKLDKLNNFRLLFNVIKLLGVKYGK